MYNSRSKAQKAALWKAVLVIGCGDIGQSVIAQLAEYGVPEISAVDPAAADNGKSKVFLAEAAAKQINPELKFRAWRTAFDEAKAGQMLKDKAVVINTVADGAFCLLLEDQCAEAGVPLLSSVMEGWCVRILFSRPKGKTYCQYLDHKPFFGNKAQPNPFVVGAAASVLAAEAVKVLQQEQSPLADGVLQVDLKRAAFNIFAPDDSALYKRTIRIHLTYSTGEKDLEIPAETTLNQLMERYESESVYAMVNSMYIAEEKFGIPILEDGDDVLLRRNVFIGGG